MNVLIVEDNQDLTANLAEYLEQQGEIIDTASDGTQGFNLANQNDYDVIILDLTLPGMDGLEVCKKLRQTSLIGTPILMLTARDTVEDKLEGFKSGADDYLVKPFSLRELHARLTALHLRDKGNHVKHVIQVGDLVLNLGTFEVNRGQSALELTPIEFQILMLLMKCSPDVVKREHIEREIWGDIPPDSDALRSHIHSLRNAIDKPFTLQLLHTVRGVGYRLVSHCAV